MSNKQTILGSGGAIGTPLAKELLAYTSEIRLVGRNPQKVNPGDELFPADLASQADVDRAVEGSSVVYLTVGLKYSLRVWEAEWPVVMQNVISACRKHSSAPPTGCATARKGSPRGRHRRHAATRA